MVVGGQSSQGDGGSSQEADWKCDRAETLSTTRNRRVKPPGNILESSSAHQASAASAANMVKQPLTAGKKKCHSHGS